MKKPIVSVLMPVKNTELFLTECLDSILNQSFENWELIAVDDNSEDNSWPILTSYSQKDNRIKIIKNDSSGIISALNLAYKHSSGDFITRMDSDDIMEHEKLELMKNQLELKGRGHLAVGLVKYFSDTELGEGYRNYAVWLNNLTSSQSNFSDIYKECSIPSPCWMLCREDFDSCGAFNSQVYPEDYDLAFRFRKAELKVASVNKVIHQWRDYDSRTSRIDKNYSDNRFFQLKIDHFLDQDYSQDAPLVIWGAGNKGKKIASLLAEKRIQFHWICNNSNKIGREIYGTYLKDLIILNKSTKSQIIVSVSSPCDSDEIEKMIAENQQHQYFRFC